MKRLFNTYRRVYKIKNDKTSELNKDIILDKINLTGIESLSELDKKILNS